MCGTAGHSVDTAEVHVCPPLSSLVSSFSSSESCGLAAAYGNVRNSSLVAQRPMNTTSRDGEEGNSALCTDGPLPVVPMLNPVKVHHGCHRGELSLSAEELKQIQVFMAHHGSHCWRFEPVDKDWGADEGSGRRKRFFERFDDDAVDQALRRLSPWARQLHQILSKLLGPTSGEEVIAPSLTALDPHWPPLLNDPRHRTYLERIHPAPEPLGSRTILCKLEEGHYTSPFDFFSDLYTSWVCDFRYFEPGSELWCELFDRAQAFINRVDTSALKDIDSLNRDVPINLGPSRSVSQGTPRQKPAELPLTAKKSNTRKKEPRRRKFFGNTAITQEERQAMHAALSCLSIEQHLQLYQAFKNTACWLTLEDGIVELDDANTLPSIFRQMLAWCKEKGNALAAAL